MINICDAALMSCEVAVLPLKANANYGTWSIDFDQTHQINLFNIYFVDYVFLKNILDMYFL